MGKNQTIALFGEAERGNYKTPYFFRGLPELQEALGNPPEESQGLFFAIHTLLNDRPLIYFRVEEEGFSEADYFWGFKYLEDRDLVKEISALCLPGVGDPQILDATMGVCQVHNSFLIMNQKDLFDYLSS